MMGRFMNYLIKGILPVAALVVLFAFTMKPAAQQYKCLIQMTNYAGPKAYLVISLMDPEGQYVRTLEVHGDDEEWHKDIKEWWSFTSAAEEEIDGITGASVGNGERKVSLFDFDKSLLNAGYKLRFETAVEDQDYFVKDLEVDLNSEELINKFEGSGYIRYIRIMGRE